MNEADALDIAQAAIWTVIVASGPAVLAAMIVGVSIAFIQALTGSGNHPDLRAENSGDHGHGRHFRAVHRRPDIDLQRYRLLPHRDGILAATGLAATFAQASAIRPDVSMGGSCEPLPLMTRREV